MEKFRAIGLMSGTSLDGLDICYAEFYKNQNWNFEILKAETLAYPKSVEDQLKNAMHLSSADLLALNIEYGFYLGQKVKNFIERNKINDVDLVSSHGHTVFHQPHRKFTLQIGDGRAIHSVINLPVIYDFRSQDVILGGNGAPLVPIGDNLLFANYDACVNLGGFSNISFNKDGKRIAFDISPVNIILNKLAENFNLKYDDGGQLASKGIVLPDLLQILNALEFYKINPPKSLGVEWCNEYILPLIALYEPLDFLATFTVHVAIQISNVINDFQLNKVLFTGGGSYNTYLIDKIKEQTNAEIVIPCSEIINNKEALIFAFMGVLRWLNEDNVYASATGSSRNHSAGIIVQ